MGDEDIKAALEKAEQVDVSEKMAAVEEQLKAITPEFISEKFDEALQNPDVARRLEEHGLSIKDITDQKPELVQKLHSDMENLLSALPAMQEKAQETAQERIQQAIDDFPAMFDDALQSEVSKSIERADQRMQTKFADAAAEREEARVFLENGEMPTDPNSKIVKQYDEAALNLADTIMQMHANDPKSAEVMKNTVAEQGDFGKQVAEIVNERIAQEAAGADTNVSAPGIK
tara:strand:- start:1087 stop:1779 length:693 start_codon:yes stop_codon:yes gene_type:complete